MPEYRLDERLVVRMLSRELIPNCPKELMLEMGGVWLRNPAAVSPQVTWDLVSLADKDSAGPYVLLPEGVYQECAVHNSKGKGQTWILGKGIATAMQWVSDEGPAFIRFARASRSKDAILDYVQEVGLPHVDRSIPREALQDVAREQPADRATGERLEVVHAAATRLRFFLHVAVAQANGDASFISEHREALHTLIAFYQSRLARVSRSLARRWGESLSPSEERSLAATLINLQATYYLSHASPVVLSGDRAGTRLLLKGFLPALYAQAFSHIESASPLGICEMCQLPFVGARSTRRFCSDRCSSLSRVQRFRAGGGQRRNVQSAKRTH